jgi:hypothetical protein
VTTVNGVSAVDDVDGVVQRPQDKRCNVKATQRRERRRWGTINSSSSSWARSSPSSCAYSTPRRRRGSTGYDRVLRHRGVDRHLEQQGDTTLEATELTWADQLVLQGREEALRKTILRAARLRLGNVSPALEQAVQALTGEEDLLAFFDR